MPPPLPFPHLSFPIDQVVSVASIDTMACDLHGSLLIGLGGSSVTTEEYHCHLQLIKLSLKKWHSVTLTAVSKLSVAILCDH